MQRSGTNEKTVGPTDGTGGDVAIRRGPLERLRRRGRERGWSRDGRDHRRRRPVVANRGLMLLYAGLLGVCAFTIVVAVRYPGSAFADKFAPNIASESMSALLTIAVVRRLLERQERARRLRGSVGALRKSGRALSELMDAWATLIKGARAFASPVPGTADALFVPYVTEDLMLIDPGHVREGGDEPYVALASARLRNAQEQLNGVIAMYGADLEPDYKEMLDALIDDPFIALVAKLASQPAEARTWRVALNTARGHREVHFARLMSALRMHNDLAGEAARYRSHQAAPHSDVLGIRRALDHDTRVDTTLSREWWAAAPRPGALKVQTPEKSARHAAGPGAQRPEGAAPLTGL